MRQMQSKGENGMRQFLTLSGGFGFGSMSMLALDYVITSLTLAKILKNIGYPKTQYAWIPIFNIYVLATVMTKGINSTNVFFVNIPTNRYRLGWLVILILSLIPSVGTKLALVARVFYYGDLYSRVYASLEHDSVDNHNALGIISAIIPFIVVIKTLSAPDMPIQVEHRSADLVA